MNNSSQNHSVDDLVNLINNISLEATANSSDENRNRLSYLHLRNNLHLENFENNSINIRQLENLENNLHAEIFENNLHPINNRQPEIFENNLNPIGNIRENFEDPSNNNYIENLNIFEEVMDPIVLNIDPLKYLSKLPEFSGDYRDLQNFTDLIDKVHPLLLRYDALAQSIFSDVIKSRLKGKAREAIEINNHVTSWLEIKEILINNFGDRSSLEELFDQLRGVTFKTNCVNFYNEIKTTLRRLNVKTRLTSGADLEYVEQTIANNKSSALTIFKNKIPEPMRSILYCRNPENLETAMDILHESGYAYYNITPHRVVHQNPHRNRNAIQNNDSNPRNTNVDNRGNRYNRNNNRNSYNGNQNPVPFRNQREDSLHNQRWQRQNLTQRLQNPFSHFNNQITNSNPPQFRPQNIPENPFRNQRNHFNHFNNPQPNNQFPPPEPMDININEAVQPPQNFPLPASTTSYPTS